MSPICFTCWNRINSGRSRRPKKYSTIISYAVSNVHDVSLISDIIRLFLNHIGSLTAKDNWLVNGLFDYYLSTNSLRTAEVLAGVREPHDKHLLDRLSDILSKSGNSRQRLQALTLLGHIARRQPTWLYKLASHALFRDLLKLLKVIYFSVFPLLHWSVFIYVYIHKLFLIGQLHF